MSAKSPSRLALADVLLRLLVRLGGSGPDHVEAEVGRQPAQLGCGHARILPVKAVRIHEDGGPEVLRYEDVPDPEPGPGEALVELRAAGLNHLDVWVRKGLPSVPKPRILGADGAGVVAALGDGVTGIAVGDRVVINPGIVHDGRITVIGEHTDGTYCELKAIPATQLYPLDGVAVVRGGRRVPARLRDRVSNARDEGRAPRGRVGARLGDRRRRRAGRVRARARARSADDRDLVEPRRSSSAHASSARTSP